MAEIQKYDAIIIGTGQSGIPLAQDLAKAGWKTAIVESKYVGGSCINYGCTPTKAMVASAKIMDMVNKAAQYGVYSSIPKINLPDVIARKNKIVEDFRKASIGKLQTENLFFISGTAGFEDKYILNIKLISGENKKITAKKIFINTGSSPNIPPLKGLSTLKYFNSTTFMDLEELPVHLIIIGGGYIGVEFGQMYKRFGSEVSIVEIGNQLLGREDNDIADELKKILTEEGIIFHLNSKITLLEKTGNGSFKMNLGTPDGEKIIVGSHLLVAAGYKPNIEELNLQAAGIETDKKGFIKVNDKLETNINGIYAMGDVKGGPAFTHISYDDYRIIRKNLLEKKHAAIKNRLVSYTVFTDPQLGRVGLSERDAKELGLKIKVAKMPMSYVARAYEVSETRGFMKAVIDKETGQILGCAILGIDGGELMSMIQIAMMGKLHYSILMEGIFAHPTLAESLNNLFKDIE